MSTVHNIKQENKQEELLEGISLIGIVHFLFRIPLGLSSSTLALDSFSLIFSLSWIAGSCLSWSGTTTKRRVIPESIQLNPVRCFKTFFSFGVFTTVMLRVH